MSARSTRNGFTLIELLVVVSIIALLVSILMPALGRARESAKNAVCASNLKQWATVAFAFASDHDGWMPKAFRHGNMNYSVSMPIAINDVTSNKTEGGPAAGTDDTEEWKTYGTPWDVLEEYGLVEEICLCPAQKWLGQFQSNTGQTGGEELQFWPEGAWGGEWRRVVMQTYMFVAGIRDNKVNENTDASHNYGQIAPYTGVGDRQPATKLLFADTVMYVTPGQAWGSEPVNQECFFNHKSSNDSTMPANQNLAFADSHVESYGPGTYVSLEEDARDQANGWWSYRHGGAGWGPWFYWEGSRSESRPIH